MIKEHVESFNKCSECGEYTCQSKLDEFGGKCEDCHYKED